jgi:hypothetical protein
MQGISLAQELFVACQEEFYSMEIAQPCELNPVEHICVCVCTCTCAHACAHALR